MTNNICVGIVAHVDAGKTTLTEQFLYKAGALKKLGRVDHKDAVADSLSVEKERGITVRASTLSFSWKGKTIQLLDTPGHVDFIAEVERALGVLDAAILVVSAKEGVQAQTRVIFHALKRLGIPTIIFINKVDRFGVDLESVYSDIRQYLADTCIPLQAVKHVSSKETALVWLSEDKACMAYADDILSLGSDAYLEMLINYPERVDDAFRFLEIKRQCLQTACYPILHGAALHGIGIDPLLDTLADIVTFIPEIQLRARCYKVDRDDFGNRRCFLRVYGGVLILRESYPVNGGQWTLKIRQLATLRGINPMSQSRVEAGEIAIIYDNDLKIEDQLIEPLCEKGIAPLEHIAVPTYIANVQAAHLAERKAILHALDILTDEDPFLDYRIHPLTDAIEMKLFGRVQKEIVLDLMKERFGIVTCIESPKTLYKQKPTRTVSAVMQMYKDTHLAASVGLSVEPMPEGSGFVYETLVSYGDLKKPFQQAVYEGVKKTVENGVREWALTDLKVVFTFSEFDSVNSTPSDYRKLAPEVLKKALVEEKLLLLEPLWSYHLEVPSFSLGKAIADMLRMRGTVSEPLLNGDTCYLSGIVPVDSSKGYLQELADFTEGKGLWSTSFFGYRALPEA